jgi:hypothetical protein
MLLLAPSTVVNPFARRAMGYGSGPSGAADGGAPSNLTTFTVEGVEQFNNDTINLPNGTTSVAIAATNGGSITTGPTGDTGLSTGDNICTFTITAEDGVTTLDVTLTLHVLTAATGATIQLNFVDVSAAQYGELTITRNGLAPRVISFGESSSAADVKTYSAGEGVPTYQSGEQVAGSLRTFLGSSPIDGVNVTGSANQVSLGTIATGGVASLSASIDLTLAALLPELPLSNAGNDPS